MNKSKVITLKVGGVSRRYWLRTAGAVVGGLALPKLLGCGQQAESPTRVPQVVDRKVFGANEQIGVGIIGCGRRNGQLVTGNVGELPKEARIVAVADVNIRRAEQWAKKYQCKPFQDYRKMLELKEVDVVIYATPEHSHYLPCIHACQAGKDIYGEQPLSHTIREGQVMVKAVRKYKRVFQTGEQQRSHPKTRRAVELILNGRIGKIQKVIGYNYPSPWDCQLAEEPVPEGLDWDHWCGQNEIVPFNINIYLSRVPYERGEFPLEPAEKAAIGPGWMSLRPYSGGELVNWGCHGLSMVLWALGMDKSGPTEIWVEPPVKLEKLVYDKPEKRDRGDQLMSSPIIHYRFPNGVELELSGVDKRLGGGATFIGEKGTITIFRNGYECNPKDLDKEELPSDAIRVEVSDNHMQNFFDCVRSRKDPIVNVEIGHRIASLCHLGNIARWLGRRLQWDPEKEVFIGDDEANLYLDCPKRKGYELPEEV
ncbi:MAG: Gfo/Idh/MocA family oxidoreductase [Thermoguttaceae bacterium]|nr:Gfo/Idh/MocA family oxidoreductase [Thermoguttaceae bacterium]MDW8078521.1 Gfo/Idh/MocA family oxidoreductase [Thermoguttaceae bacterium]